MKLLIFFIFILFQITSSVCFSSTYYVTQGGSGSSSGNSLSNSWSMANYNSSSIPTGGDTVYFSGVISSQVSPNSSGTGNGTGRLILDFSGATLSGGISLNAKNYVTFIGGTFSSGSKLITCGTIVAHDITISNFNYTGPINGTQEFISVGKCNHLLIVNNTVDNIASFVSAYNGATSDIIVRNNYARTSTNQLTQTDLLFFGDTSNVTIEGNKFIHRAPGTQSNSRHNDVIQTFQSGSSSNATPANWIIRYNWIEMAVPAGTDTDGSNSWTMLENMSGTVKIYSNVFVGGGGSVATNGMNFNSCYSSVIVYLYNNTFIAHKTPVNTVRFQNSGTLYSANNVGQADGISGTTLQWDWFNTGWNRNFFYNFGNCNSTFTGSGGSCNLDPHFTNYTGNDFSLRSTSPLLTAGDGTIGNEYNQGISPGATWPNPFLSTRSSTGTWEVGAYVFAAGSPTKLAAPMNLRVQ